MADEVKNPYVIFISGNTDLPEETFLKYYAPVLSGLAKSEEKIYFVLSDDDGCAAMAQLFLKVNLKDKKVVSVFGKNEKPHNYVDSDFVYVSGFKSIEERDAAMTLISNKDVHVVIGGKGSTAVKNNILRRLTPDYDFTKYCSTGNKPFWMGLFSKTEELDEELTDNTNKN